MATSGVEDQDKYRSYLHGEGEKNTKWRFGAPPNYDLVDKLFEEGRTKLDEQMKIVKVEFYFDRGELLGGLMEGASLDSSTVEEASICPFLKNTG